MVSTGTNLEQGSSVGNVISSWQHNGTMELVLYVDERMLEGAFVRQFVETGMCKVCLDARGVVEEGILNLNVDRIYLSDTMYR
jgi:hypothetical protein